MIGTGGIQVLSSQQSTLASLGVVVFETNHPLTGWCLCRPLANGGLYVRDGPQVTIDLAQMPQTGVAGMRMSVDEPGDNCATGEVHFRSAGCRQRRNFFIGTNSQEAAVGDSDRLGTRLRRIHGQNVCVQQNKLGLALTQRQQRQSRQLMQKPTSRRTHDRACKGRPVCLPFSGTSTSLD
jgi:hypothetical protein